VQRDAEGKVDTVVLDFGKRKFSKIFMSLDQTEWIMKQFQGILKTRKAEGQPEVKGRA
jgi:hypothetical protein